MWGFDSTISFRRFAHRSSDPLRDSNAKHGDSEYNSIVGIPAHPKTISSNVDGVVTNGDVKSIPCSAHIASALSLGFRHGKHEREAWVSALSILVADPPPHLRPISITQSPSVVSLAGLDSPPWMGVVVTDQFEMLEDLFGDVKMNLGALIVWRNGLVCRMGTQLGRNLRYLDHSLGDPLRVPVPLSDRAEAESVHFSEFPPALRNGERLKSCEKEILEDVHI
jgi:hypothetical protein